MAPTECPVCLKNGTVKFLSVNGVTYHRCPVCLATFVGESFLPDPEEEKARYAHHKNDPLDPDYRRFLGKIYIPLTGRLSGPKEGLDFGCGTGPALADMLKDAGHKVELYDPFFYPDTSVLDKRYDFIVCTEVFEHFHFPHKEFKLLDRLLKPKGLLAVMTCFQTDDSRFKNWHYRRDITHVVFYKEETMRYIAKDLNWDVEVPVKDVVFFTKSR